MVVRGPEASAMLPGGRAMVRAVRAGPRRCGALGLVRPMAPLEKVVTAMGRDPGRATCRRPPRLGRRVTVVGREPTGTTSASPSS